jgi:hypothetical protein
MRWRRTFMTEVFESLQQLGLRACPVCGSAESLNMSPFPVVLLALPSVHMSYMPCLRSGRSRSSPAVLSSSVEDVVFAGDVNAGDVVVLPGTSSAVLVKTVRLGQGGFIFTVAPIDDDRPQAEQLVTLTASARLRKHGRDLAN